MLLADAVRLPCVSGTIFGFEVVPEVWSTSAVSSVPRSPPFRVSPRVRGCREKSPGELMGNEVDQGNVKACCCGNGRRGAVIFHDQSFYIQVFHAKAEFVFAKRRVQGSCDACRRDSHEGCRQERPIGHDNCHLVGAAKSRPVETLQGFSDKCCEAPIVQRLPFRCRNCYVCRIGPLDNFRMIMVAFWVGFPGIVNGTPISP